KDCVKLADATLQKFDKLMDLLQEIIEVTAGTHSSNHAAVHEIGTIINNTKHEEQVVANEIQSLQQEFDSAQTALHLLLNGITTWLALSFPPNNFDFENAEADLAYENLKKAEQRYDVYYPELLQKQNTLTQKIQETSQLNLETIDAIQIIKILVSAMKELANLKAQWDKLARFFHSIAGQVQSTQQMIMSQFVETIQAVQLMGDQLDAADRQFFLVSLFEIAGLIDTDAHLLYIMSKTYHDISSTYMINQVASVSSLLVTETDTERELLLKQMGQETLNTSAKVSRLAETRKQQYEQRIESRQLQLEIFLLYLIYLLYFS
ncbi:unnamed protein product, partial [Didymodactylos carnosus]